MHIRLYQPSDLSSVRAICCDTADRGNPIDSLFPDREVFADLLMRYYTVYEPHALWVAQEEGGQVVGYLTGCLNNYRYGRLMMWSVIPRTVVKAIRHGALRSLLTWRWARAGWSTWLRQKHRAGISLSNYPAHLHVNLLPDFRGQHIGQALVLRFLQQAHEVGVGGVHAAVRGDNLSSCRFFERLGFSEVGRTSTAFPNGTTYAWHDTIVYGTRL